MYRTSIMTKVSRIAPTPYHMRIFVDNFWNAVTLLGNKDEAKIFLEDLLTHTEIKMLSKRIQITKMLLQGYDYQVIKQYVKVTSGTIARISNTLNTRGEGLKHVVDDLIKFETEQNLKKDQQYNKIIPSGPMRLVPDLIEGGVELSIQSIKKHKKRISVSVIPFDK
jgi:TrpR-related protein YerC/YecD